MHFKIFYGFLFSVCTVAFCQSTTTKFILKKHSDIPTNEPPLADDKPFNLQDYCSKEENKDSCLDYVSNTDTLSLEQKRTVLWRQIKKLEPNSKLWGVGLQRTGTSTHLVAFSMEHYQFSAHFAMPIGMNMIYNSQLSDMPFKTTKPVLVYLTNDYSGGLKIDAGYAMMPTGSGHVYTLFRHDEVTSKLTAKTQQPDCVGIGKDKFLKSLEGRTGAAVIVGPNRLCVSLLDKFDIVIGSMVNGNRNIAGTEIEIATFSWAIWIKSTSALEVYGEVPAEWDEVPFL